MNVTRFTGDEIPGMVQATFVAKTTLQNQGHLCPGVIVLRNTATLSDVIKRELRRAINIAQICDTQ